MRQKRNSIIKSTKEIFSYTSIVVKDGSFTVGRSVIDGCLQVLGVIAGFLAFSGIHLSNNKFNGRIIDRYHCSPLLDDDMIIRRFYIHNAMFSHNFVVFQTDSGSAFKVHLIADINPGHYEPINVEILPTFWKPNGAYVGNSQKTAKNLKTFVLKEIRRFGIYDVGINDCRHFAQAVAGFLAGY